MGIEITEKGEGLVSDMTDTPHSMLFEKEGGFRCR